MGLDMYAYSLPKDDDRPCVDFDLDDIGDEERRRLHYWRKHPNLHGWMASRYYEKGGSDDDFNVNTVELTSADIDALERAILGNTLRKRQVSSSAKPRARNARTISNSSAKPAKNSRKVAPSPITHGGNAKRGAICIAPRSWHRRISFMLLVVVRVVSLCVMQ